MALQKGKNTELPNDAVVLTRKEALEYQGKILRSWKSSGDTFAFKYGSTILASASSLAGLYINGYYRRKFKLFSYGRASSYLPIVIVPAAMSFFLHLELVMPDVILQNNCPVCLQLRASAIQSTLGCILPAFLAPISALALATQYNTYVVPYITKEPMEVFKLYRKMTKPIGNTLFAIFLAQALLASAVTYFESKSVITVNEKLIKLEKELERRFS